MTLLGALLLILGVLIGIEILKVLGTILLVIGVVLLIVSATGRSVGGRRHWF